MHRWQRERRRRELRRLVPLRVLERLRALDRLKQQRGLLAWLTYLCRGRRSLERNLPKVVLRRASGRSLRLRSHGLLLTPLLDVGLRTSSLQAPLPLHGHLPFLEHARAVLRHLLRLNVLASRRHEHEGVRKGALSDGQCV